MRFQRTKLVHVGFVALALLMCGAPSATRSYSQCPVLPDLVAKFLWLTESSEADPPDPDSVASHELVVYQGSFEAGRVYRNVVGPRYTEHWVLYPEFQFDSGVRVGQSMRVETVAGIGYASVEDFLARVPFPKGSRYVIADCQEFDELPIGR